MSRLLEKALEKVACLPQDEQDAIASQILASLADEDAWKKRFAEKRDVIRGWLGKPLRRTRGARRFRWTHCFDAVPDHPAFLAFVFQFADRRSTGRQARLSPLPEQPGAPRFAVSRKLEGEDEIYKTVWFEHGPTPITWPRSQQIGDGPRGVFNPRAGRLTICPRVPNC